MSSFTRANVAIVYDRQASLILGRDYWRNIKPYRFYIGAEDSNEWVDVPAGLLSDGATVPFPVNALIPAWGSYSPAVVLHDRLCNTYTKTKVINGVETQVKITRVEIDDILGEAMQILGVEPWRQDVIMLGVDFYRILKRPQGPRPNPTRARLELQYDPRDYDL